MGHPNYSMEGFTNTNAVKVNVVILPRTFILLVTLGAMVFNFNSESIIILSDSSFKLEVTCTLYGKLCWTTMNPELGRFFLHRFREL